MGSSAVAGADRNTDRNTRLRAISALYCCVLALWLHQVCDGTKLAADDVLSGHGGHLSRDVSCRALAVYVANLFSGQFSFQAQLSCGTVF